MIIWFETTEPSTTFPALEEQKTQIILPNLNKLKIILSIFKSLHSSLPKTILNV